MLREILNWSYSQIKQQLEITSNATINRTLERYHLTGDIEYEFNLRGNNIKPDNEVMEDALYSAIKSKRTSNTH